MADVKQEVILEFNADTGDVDKTVVALGQKLDRLADSIELMANEFSKSAEAAEEVTDAVSDTLQATDDLNKETKKTGGILSRAAKLGSDGFKLVGTAIAATGLLGLVTKVLMPIVDAFLENKKVADTLRVAMAGVGAVIDTIVDLTGPLVEKLSAAFSDPKQAVIDLKDAIKENIETRIEGLLNLFPRLGDAIKAAFSGNFAEAGKIAADAMGQVALGVENVTEVVSDAVDGVIAYKDEFVATVTEQVQGATQLEEAMIRLDDRQRELNVSSAQQRAEVEELKRLRDDERLSIEERVAAAEAAAAIDQRLADENVAIAEDRARLLRQELELQGETEERLQELADAQIAAADARAASAAVQTELQTSIFSLNNEAIAQEQEIAALRREFVNENLEGVEAEKQAVRDQYQDRIAALALLKISEEQRTQLEVEAAQSRDAQLLAIEEATRQEQLDILQGYIDEANTYLTEQEGSDRARELDAVRESYAERIALAESLGQDTLVLTEAQRQAELEINKKYDELEVEARKQRQQATLDVAKQSLDALAAINQAFTGDSEEEQKKGFERSKKIQTAQALISTYESAVQAFKSLAGIPVVGPGLGAAAAAAATAAGLANVKQIQSQQYQSAGGGGGGSSYSGAGTAGQAAQAAQQTPTAPVLDLGFLGAGSEQQVIETYVISENVTNAQQANKKIQDQATL